MIRQLLAGDTVPGQFSFSTGPTSLNYTLRAAAYGNWRLCLSFRMSTASYDRLATLSVDLVYKSLRRSLGAIDDELGSTWGAASAAIMLVLRFTRVSARWVPWLLLSLDHSSNLAPLLLGTSMGDNRNRSVARSYFGGFGNNWVDYGGSSSSGIRRFSPLRSTRLAAQVRQGAGGVGVAAASFRKVGVPSLPQVDGLSYSRGGLVTLSTVVQLGAAL